MRRLALALLCLTAPLAAEPLKVAVAARSAILMNADTGAILFSKSADRTHYPASIVKVATALLVLERKETSLDELATARQQAVASISPEAKRRANYKTPSHWIELASSHIGIKLGEQLSLRTLLYGLMLQSGNDAANVLAQHVTGDIPKFTDLLNKRAAELGCRHTHFTNPSGLHHPQQVTTAYDMAVLTRAAMRFPEFCKIVASLRYEKPASNLQPAIVIHQKNRLIRAGKYYYPKAIGVKIGFTQDSRGTLIAAAKDGERTLIAVVLGCQTVADAFQDVAQMFDAAFAELKVQKRVLSKGLQKFTRSVFGGKELVTTLLQDDLNFSYYPSEAPQFQLRLTWHEIEPPVPRGNVVGKLEMTDVHGTVLKSMQLFAGETVEPTLSLKVQRLKEHLVEVLPSRRVVLFVVGALFLGFGLLVFMRARPATG